MKNQTTLIEVKAKPLDNEALAYRLILPESWGAETAEVGTKDLLTDRMIPIGVFTGADSGASATVSVAAMKLSRPVAAADWISGYCLAHQHKVIEIHEVARHLAFGYSSFRIGAQEQLAILGALVDGDRLFFVQGFAPASVAAYVEGRLKDYVESFLLLNPAGDEGQEEVYKGLCGGIGYLLPGKWQCTHMAAQNADNGASDCFSSSPSGAMNCWLRVKCRKTAKPPVLDKDLSALGQDLLGANIVFKQDLRQIKFPRDFLDGGIGRVLLAHPAGNEASELEVTCAALASGNSAFSFFAVYPSQANDYLAWAQGKYTLSHFLSSLQRL